MLKAAIAATPAVAAVALLSSTSSPSSTARAATQLWDINGTSAGATDDGGGVANGVWDNAASNWTADTAGTSTTALWASGNLAVFSAGTNATGVSTVTISGTQTITGLTFEEGNVLLTGGGLTLTGATDTITATADASIASTIGGTSAMTKAGTGTLSLSGALSYGGTTTVSAGTLVLSGANTLGGNTTVNAGTLTLDYTVNNNDKIKSTGTLTLGNGATINLLGANGAQDTVQSVASTSLSSNGVTTINVNKGDTQNTTLNLGGITRGTGALTTLNAGGAGPGSVIITTTNTGTGGILGGYATFGTSDWVGVTGGNLAPLASYAADGYAAADNTDANTDQSPAADIAINSLRFNSSAAPVTVTLTGTNNSIATGGILVTPAVAGNAVGITGGSLTSGSNDLIVIQNNSGSEFTIASQLTGTVGLTKGGPGTLVLSNPANSATGTHTINGGTLKNGATEVIPNNVAMQINAAGTWELNGFQDTVGTIAGAGSITGSGNVITAGNGSTTYSGPISIAGNLNKGGTGTLTLSGTNTFTGALNVNQGVVSVTNTSALGAAGNTAVVATGAALQVSGNTSYGLAIPLTLNGTGIGNAGALRKTANNTSTYAGAITLNTTSTRINSDAGTLRLGSTVGGNGTDVIDASFGGAGNITVAGAIQNTINKVIYDGTGTLTLTTNSQFTGGIIINNGGAVGHPGFAGSSSDPSGALPTAFVPDYFQLTNGSIIKDNGTGVGRTAIHPNKGIYLGTGGGKIEEISDTTNVHIYRGLISGPGSFTKQGAGILAITGSQHTYAGATFINGGVLRIRQDTGPGQLGPGTLPITTALTIAAGATFDMNVSSSASNITVGSLAGAGALQAISNSSGTFTFGSDGTLTLFNGTVTSNGTPGTTTLTITKVGTSILTIGTNNWQNTRTTSINGGAIKYGDSVTGLGDIAPISIGASGTMDMNNIFPAHWDPKLRIPRGQVVAAASIVSPKY